MQEENDMSTGRATESKESDDMKQTGQAIDLHPDLHQTMRMMADVNQAGNTVTCTHETDLLGNEPFACMIATPPEYARPPPLPAPSAL